MTLSGTNGSDEARGSLCPCLQRPSSPRIEDLRAYCAREGYEVLEEVRDEGWSGAYLERSGLDRVRDLVEAGNVGVALAQVADRITRDPGHRAFLDDEFERLGSRLVALDDWGDNTHEGELLKFLKGWVSKGERLKIAQRSRRGMLRKALEGKVILPPIPDYVSWPWNLWIAVAGTLLVIGGLAWISKLWVIAMCAFVVVGALAAFFSSFALFTAIGYALVAVGRAVVGDALPAYLLEKGGIFIAAVVWLAVGVWLLAGVSLRGGARGAARATGDRGSGYEPRVR